MSRYKHKYRNISHRLKGWDYGSDAFYFITICTGDRKCYFGDVQDGIMKLSAIGNMINSYWMEIPQHYAFVILRDHIVMPNHIHGIIEITKNDDVDVRDDTSSIDDESFKDGSSKLDDSLIETPKLGAPTSNASQEPSDPPQILDTSHEPINRIHNASKKWKPNTLGSIINQYKRICTINAQKINPDFS